MSTADLIVKMDRIVCAARVARWAQNNLPGDDLGSQAKALAAMEMVAALEALDAAFPDGTFDARAALADLAKQHGVKIAGVTS